MSLIRSHQIEALVEHVTAHAPDLLPTSRWLLIDPRLAPVILGPEARAPSAADLSRFLRLLREAPAEAAAAGHTLLVARSRLTAELDFALEHLLAAADNEWHHPAEVLGRPCPSFARLYQASSDRPESGNGARRRLASARDKLLRAMRLEATARQRRDSGW